jgi:hypothetical protein
LIIYLRQGYQTSTVRRVAIQTSTRGYKADAANQDESINGKADLRWRNLNSTTMDDGASCEFENEAGMVRSEFQANARSVVLTLSVIAKSWFWIDRIRTMVLIDCRGQKRKAQRRVVESGRERGSGERGA